MSPHPPRPLWKRILKWTGIVLALLIVGLVLFVALFDFTGMIERAAGKNSGREVKLDGKVDIQWGWTPKVTLKGIEIGNMVGLPEPLMASAQNIEVTVDAKKLLRGRIAIPELVLENPDIILEKDKDGNANWNFGDNPEGKAVGAVTPDDRSEVPEIGRLLIKNGRLRYRDAQAGIDIDSKLNTVVGAVNRTDAIHIEGKGTYQKKPFKLDVTAGSVLTLKDTDEPYPIKLDVTIGNTRAQIDGTVMEPLQLKGLNLKLDLKGKDASDLYDITGIALPKTPPYHLNGQLGLEDKVWKFNGFTGKMGSSDLAGSLSWDTRPEERPIFTANFTSNNLDFADLAGFIGATPDIKADSSAEQKAQAAKEKADSKAIPDVPLDISRLKSMDADVQFKAKRIKATDLPLDDFLMKLHLDNLLLTLKPLKFGTASGDVVANMEINARKEPVTIGGDFEFRRLSLERLFGGLEKSLGAAPSKGYIGGRAKLKGTGKSLRDMLGSSNGSIGLGMEGGQLSNLIVEILGLDVAQSLGFLLAGDEPVPIRCVIADFGVKGGLMKSNAIVIDTKDTQVHGKGTLNLKTEAMDIRLKAEPKDASILSIRTPITIGGTLKDPAIGVQTSRLLARGGAAGALAVAFPPAAILAFIDPGLGEDSDCGKLVRDMNAKAGSGKFVPKNP